MLKFLYDFTDNSLAQFKRPDLGENVAEVLRRTGLGPRALILQITESIVVEDVDAPSPRFHGPNGIDASAAC